MVLTVFFALCVLGLGLREWQRACGMAERSNMPLSAFLKEVPGRFTVPFFLKTDP